MIGGLSGNYHCEALGAPFRIELLNSVIVGEEGVVIPAYPALVARVGIERLREPRRLGGEDMMFLRRCAKKEQGQFAQAIGIGENECAEYESNSRPMNTTIEKLVRIYLHDCISRTVDIEDFADNIAYLDWVMDWKPTPTEAGDTTMKLTYQSAVGWTRII